MKRITVYIDRLVLRGVDRNDQVAVVQGLKDQLVARLAQSDVSTALTGLGNVARLWAGELPAVPAEPRELGSGAADAIADGIRA